MLEHLNYTKTANDDQEANGKYFTDLANSLPTYYGTKTSLNGLINWFKELLIISNSDGHGRGLDVIDRASCKTDATKLKSYRDSKEAIDKIKVANIPALFTADGDLNEGILRAIVPIVASHNSSGNNNHYATMVVQLGQEIVAARTYLNNISDLTENNLRPYKEAYDSKDDLDAYKALYNEVWVATGYNPTADDLDPTDFYHDLKNKLAGKTLDEVIQEAGELQNRENQIRTACGFNPTANIPND